jgi:hypothetical protein
MIHFHLKRGKHGKMAESVTRFDYEEFEKDFDAAADVVVGEFKVVLGRYGLELVDQPNFDIQYRLDRNGVDVHLMAHVARKGSL